MTKPWELIQRILGVSLNSFLCSTDLLEDYKEDYKAIANLKQALPSAVAKLTALDPNYREMAKTDADFDGVRSDDRFQALLED